ncbi:MFS transporter [Streptomyces kanamyceticus]|uniref:MFS transporter n=1 Tax=Streptomyces kanamyceticus TaxID=1967 RepID=UPI000AD9B4FC|nr:MFS transporter [Streptomyces kanamyceticus]
MRQSLPLRVTAQETFASLHNRAFRVYLSGQLAAHTGTWMIRIAQDWLVLQLTGSSTAVGATIALQFMPLLVFGLYGGVLADRCAKRHLLLTTQATFGLVGAVLAVLAFTHTVNAWHIYAAALLCGLASAVDNPTRQSFLSDLVDSGDVRNAVSLNIAVFQLSRMLGPAVASALLTTTDSSWGFLGGALLFLGPMRTLTSLGADDAPRSRSPVRSQGCLREGMRCVADRPDLTAVIALSTLTGTFGYAYPVWLSAFAADTFPTGVGLYGMFNTAMAMGALIGALLTSRGGSTRVRELSGHGAVLGLLEAAAAVAPTAWSFTVLITLVGTVSMVFSTRSNAHIQLSTPPHVRGRVLSIYLAGFVGGTSLGCPIIGWITDLHGPRIGLLTSGTVCVLTAAVITCTLAPQCRSSSPWLRLSTRSSPDRR